MYVKKMKYYFNDQLKKVNKDVTIKLNYNYISLKNFITF